MKKILILFCFAFTLSCTEKGCRDESALNYQVTATQDDGSCLYCQKESSGLGELTFMMVDKRMNSIHFNDEIARIRAVQTDESYNDGSCGQSGCFVSLSIESLVSEDIGGLNFTIQFTTPTFGTFTQYFFQAISIKSGETFTWPNSFSLPSNNCILIANGTAEPNVFDAFYL